MITLESYFDFLAVDDIRFKGTRIGIETILGHYLSGINQRQLQNGIQSSLAI